MVGSTSCRRGDSQEYLGSYAHTVALWKAARYRSQTVSVIAGRVPLLLAALAVGAGVVVQSMARGEPLVRVLVHAAFLGSMAPAFVGVAQSFQENLRNARRLRAMDALLAVRPDPRKSGIVPHEPVSRIEVRDIGFAYDSRDRLAPALSGLSFAWGRGELLAVAGPNGCGKSTCLYAILGIARPQTGDVWIDGVPTSRMDLDAWRRLVAYLPQRPYLPPRATVRACLRFLEPVASEGRLRDALSGVGLGHIDLDTSVDVLSVGQRQRVGVARLLCSDRPVVLLDEPDSGLDPAGLALVAELLRGLVRERMVLVAAHSRELLDAADRVVVLEEGRVVAERRPDRAHSTDPIPRFAMEGDGGHREGGAGVI